MLREGKFFYIKVLKKTTSKRGSFCSRRSTFGYWRGRWRERGRLRCGTEGGGWKCEAVGFEKKDPTRDEVGYEMADWIFGDQQCKERCEKWSSRVIEFTRLRKSSRWRKNGFEIWKTRPELQERRPMSQCHSKGPRRFQEPCTSKVLVGVNLLQRETQVLAFYLLPVFLGDTTI